MAHFQCADGSSIPPTRTGHKNTRFMPGIFVALVAGMSKVTAYLAWGIERRNHVYLARETDEPGS